MDKANNIVNNQNQNKHSLIIIAKFFFSQFLLDIFFIYISNAIPKVPYTLSHPAPLPTHSHFLALAFTWTGAY